MGPGELPIMNIDEGPGANGYGTRVENGIRGLRRGYLPHDNKRRKYSSHSAGNLPRHFLLHPSAGILVLSKDTGESITLFYEFASALS
jgi:hypothetical protein